MKKWYKYSWLLVCICSLCLMGCSGNDDEGEEPTEVTEIKTSADSGGLTFAKGSSSQDLHIQADGTVEVTSNQTWCKVTETTSASAKVKKYTVTVETNTETSDRTALITVKAGKLTKTVDVFQTAADGLLVSTSSFEVKAEGENITVKYTTNGEPEVTIDVDWIKQAVNGRAAMQDKTLQFEVKANYSEGRTGKITFTLNNLSESVVVNQAKMNFESMGMGNDALALAAQMYTGINIGNTLEAVDTNNKVASETVWGNPKVNDTYIKGVKAAGFNAVRIPCAWDYHIIDAATHKLDEAWLSRVDEVVGFCVANDLFAIV